MDEKIIRKKWKKGMPKKIVIISKELGVLEFRSVRDADRQLHPRYKNVYFQNLSSYLLGKNKRLHIGNSVAEAYWESEIYDLYFGK